MLDLKAQVRLNSILRLDFLNGLKQDGDPLVLRVRLRDVQLVDRLERCGLLQLFHQYEVVILGPEHLLVLAQGEVAIPDHLLGSQS